MPVGPRHAGVLSASVLVSLLLSGCGVPPWRQAQSGSGSAGSTTAAPTLSPTPSPTPSVAKVKNDLAKGSAKRQLGAGGLRMNVTYWSTLDMGRWTPAATKPLNLSLTAAFADGSTQDVYLNNVAVTMNVAGPDGPLTSPDPLTDATSVPPGYLVTSPNSYVKVFDLPRFEDAATSVTVTLTYELLAQSKPKSHTYLKQSASDSLVIALAAS